MTRQQTNSCLAVGTLVDTPAGVRAIEQLKVGDQVWGFDVARHEPVLAKIESMAASQASETVRIGMLRVTPEHPIYVQGQWKPAGKLKPNDLLLTNQLTEQPAGQPQLVSGNVDVYDISVDGPNNYFASGVLVHNNDQSYGTE